MQPMPPELLLSARGSRRSRKVCTVAGCDGEHVACAAKVVQLRPRNEEGHVLRQARQVAAALVQLADLAERP